MHSDGKRAQVRNLDAKVECLTDAAHRNCVRRHNPELDAQFIERIPRVDDAQHRANRRHCKRYGLKDGDIGHRVPNIDWTSEYRNEMRLWGRLSTGHRITRCCRISSSWGVAALLAERDECTRACRRSSGPRGAKSARRFRDARQVS